MSIKCQEADKTTALTDINFLITDIQLNCKGVSIEEQIILCASNAKKQHFDKCHTSNSCQSMQQYFDVDILSSSVFPVELRQNHHLHIKKYTYEEKYNKRHSYRSGMHSLRMYYALHANKIHLYSRPCNTLSNDISTMQIVCKYVCKSMQWFESTAVWNIVCVCINGTTLNWLKSLKNVLICIDFETFFISVI